MSETEPQIVIPQVPFSERAQKDPELFRAMLAATLPTEQDSDLDRLDWSSGMLCSPKIDGVRGIKHPLNGMISRSLIPLPNRFVQEQLKDPIFDNLDGELIKGTLKCNFDYNTNQSMIMTREGRDDYFSYCVFDDITLPDNAFWWRNECAKERVARLAPEINVRGQWRLVYLEQKLLHSPEEVLAFEQEQLALGFEGIIIRDPRNRYKNNRSTFKQQGMIKLKRFTDAEAKIVGYEELMRNHNELTTDARGYAKRSSHLAGMVPAGTLGKLLCVGINGKFKDVEFSVGSGLDDDLRWKIWSSRPDYTNAIIKYKYQAHGSIAKPRSPIFLGFRDLRDM